MSEQAFTSLIIAVVPAVLSYIAGTKKSALDKKNNATTHWQELYKAMQGERDEWKVSSQRQQEQIDDLKKELSSLRGEIYKIKESYEDEIERLEEENIYLKNENERLESELIDIKEEK